MTTVVKYRCDICQQLYEDKIQAELCEEQGWFDETKYPAGLMFEHHHSGYVGVFAIPENVKRDLTVGYGRGHLGSSSYWAYRVPGYPGDSLGSEQCGSDYFRSDPTSFENWKKYHYIDKHLNGPEFKRMVRFLRNQGIIPSYYTKRGKLIIV